MTRNKSKVCLNNLAPSTTLLFETETVAFQKRGKSYLLRILIAWPQPYTTEVLKRIQKFLKRYQKFEGAKILTQTC